MQYGYTATNLSKWIDLHLADAEADMGYAAVTCCKAQEPFMDCLKEPGGAWDCDNAGDLECYETAFLECLEEHCNDLIPE